MKTIVCSLFALIIGAGSGFAQSISVSMTSGSTTLCTFTATSVDNSFGFNGASNSGSFLDIPITLARTVDACSHTLLVDLFHATVIPTVKITLSEPQPGSSGALVPSVTITLTNAYVSSLSSSLAIGSGSGATEQVQLVPSTLVIADLIDKTTVTCNYQTRSCSSS